MGWQDGTIVQAEPVWKSAPIVDDNKPAYIPVKNKRMDQEEKIFSEHTGQTYTAPFGTSRLMQSIVNDPNFEVPSGERSSTLDEVAAGFQKQAALMALVAVDRGMVKPEDAADFIAKKSQDLAHAQKNYPDYMITFAREYENAQKKGVLSTIATIFSNPRAWGRQMLTQMPNSMIPLIASLPGAITGGKAGAFIAAAAGQAGPQAAAPEEIVTVPVGAVTGAWIGSRTASAPANALVEYASTMDSLINDAGYDTTKPQGVIDFFKNADAVKSVREQAAAKGITTAAIDLVFDLAGGKLLGTLNPTTKLGRVGRAAADIGVQTVGEGASEAGGQYAAFGEVNTGDAILEAMTSFGQSVGQTGIDLAMNPRRGTGQNNVAPDALDEIATQETAPITEPETSPVVDVMADAETARIEASNIADTEIQGVSQENVKNIVTSFLDGNEPDVTNFDEAQAEAINSVLDKVTPVRDRIIKGRVRMLDNKIEAQLQHITELEGRIEEATKAGRGTKRLQNRLNSMIEEWDSMDAERADLLTIVDPIAEKFMVSGKEGRYVQKNEALASAMENDVAIEGSQIENAAIRASKTTMRAVSSAFRKARVATKRDIKSIQRYLTRVVKNSGVNAENQSKFITAITKTQTIEQLRKNAPKIQAKIEAAITEQRKAAAIADIKSTLKKVNKSEVIAIDYVNKINDMFSGINWSAPSEKTIANIKSTLAYIERNGSEGIPKNVLDSLKRVSNRNAKDISAADLEDMAENLHTLVGIGKNKLRLMKEQDARIREQRLSELRKESVPLSSIDIKRAPIGQKQAAWDSVKNKFTNGANYARRLRVNKNSMDVIFDLMSGFKEYKGAFNRIFKDTIDSDHNSYIEKKEAKTRPVKDLQDKLNLTKENFDRIGVYAAAQQEGGLDKLMNSGISNSEALSIELTPQEMQMYSLMRKQMDSLLPDLRHVMRIVYNQNVDEVENYFSFMTDHDAMVGSTVVEMFSNDAAQFGDQKNVGRGMTISRTLGKQAIRIDALGIFMKHIDNAVYLIEMGKDIKDLADMAQSDEFNKIAGDIGQTIAIDWLNLLARKGSVPNGTNAAMDTLRRNAGFAVLAFKLSSTLVQWTSLFQGGAFIGKSYLVRGINAITHQEWREFMHKNFPEVRERAGDDPAYLDFGGNGIIGKAQDAGFWALKKLDVLAASSVAAGAYMRAVEAKGGVVDFGNLDQEAMMEAQLYMRRSQSSGFFKDVAPIISQGKLTGTVWLDKLILQFQSFMLNEWSIISHDMFGAAREGKTAKAMNMATWIVLASMAADASRDVSKELISLALGVEPPEDDDEEKQYLDDGVDAAINKVPFVSTIVNSFEYGSVPVPSIDLMMNIFESAKYAGMTEDESKKARHYTNAALAAIGVLAGIPGTLQASQINNQLAAGKKDSPRRNADKNGFQR